MQATQIGFNSGWGRLPEDLLRELLGGRDDLSARSGRTIVFGQDELLDFAERAAGGSLDDLDESKPGFFIGRRSTDGKLVEVEWEPDGHANTNEGPHVTVRELRDEGLGVQGGWTVVDKAFIFGQETYRG